MKHSEAIATLEKLAKEWPPDLWIYAAGYIHVMQLGPDGQPAMHSGGGVDPDYIVATISGIPCSGGDW
jgi:hypothetical protein